MSLRSRQGVLPTAIKSHLFERLGDVAVLTLLAETAVVRIITAVTGAAGLVQLDFARHGLAMTALAMDLGVGAVELVIGILIVVEAPHLPAVRIVAIGAFAAKGLLMHVVLFVAGIAGVGIHLVAAGQMAFLAGYRRVETDEGKAGHVMVEDHPFVPFLLVVAAGALLAFLALMNIVILMAGKTGITTLFLVQVATMAPESGIGKVVVRISSSVRFLPHRLTKYRSPGD